MRFGVYLNGYGHAEPAERAARRDVVEQARLAEAAGFDWAVLGERHVHGPGHLEVLATCGYLAGATERIGIATAGIILGLYPPYFLAQALASLDNLSEGRVSAGFVLGYRAAEFRAFGVEPRARKARFVQGLETIQRLWAGERIAVEGVDPAEPEDDRGLFVSPLPWRRPRPPIWIGGRVDAVLQRTADGADAWLTGFNEFPHELAAKIERYHSFPAGPRSLGRRVIVCRDGFCAPTSQQARAAFEEPLLRFCDAYAHLKRDSIDADRYHEVDWDGLLDRLIVGSPSQVVEQILGYAERGGDDLILRVQPPALPHAQALAAIEVLGEEVLPRIRAVLDGPEPTDTSTSAASTTDTSTTSTTNTAASTPWERTLP